MKTCSKCKEYLPLADFGVNQKAPDKHQYSCKECLKIYQAEVRKNPKHREKMRVYAKHKRVQKKLQPKWYGYSLEGVIIAYQNHGMIQIHTTSLRLALDAAGYDYIPLRSEEEPRFIDKNEILMERPEQKESWEDIQNALDD